MELKWIKCIKKHKQRVELSSLCSSQYCLKMLHQAVNYEKGTGSTDILGEISGASNQGNTEEVMTEIRDSTKETKEPG
jgi:hypothetical protein